MTGDLDGVVAMWEISEFQGNNVSLIVFFSIAENIKDYKNDNDQGIISIDTNYELDLYSSASPNSVVLRIISTNKHLCTIHPELWANRMPYQIYNVLLSPRGYIVIHKRSGQGAYCKDFIDIYSINGEKVAARNIEEYYNAMIFDETGYFLMTGGAMGRITVYEIVTMDEIKSGKIIEKKYNFGAPILTLSVLDGIFRFINRI